MKKRQYTYQTDGQLSQFNLEFSHSSRSLHNRLNKLRPSTYSAAKVDNNKPASIWAVTEPVSVAIQDELSELELKSFSLHCIETMANLANFDKGQKVSHTLEKLIFERLPAFGSLVEEHNDAKNQYQEDRVSNQKFIANVQPLIKDQSATVSEVAQPTEQAVQSIEHSLFTKYKVAALANRIDCFIDSIPKSVEKAGIDLQLPSAVMAKLAIHVKSALTSIAK